MTCLFVEESAQVVFHGLRRLFLGCGLLYSVLALVLFVCLVSWAGRLWRFRTARIRPGARKRPPHWPFLMPGLGPMLSLISFAMSRDPVNWVLSSRLFQQDHPVRVRVANTELCLVQGPDAVKEVFRKSWTCTMALLHKFTLGNVFGMSGKALQLYDLDRSGYRHKPLAGTSVEPRNRIDYLTYGPITKFLSGAGMRSFWSRYELELTQKLRDLPIGNDWTDMADLTWVFEVDVSAANTNALCGPYLLRRHPDFLVDLWKLDRDLDLLFRGTPRMFAPRVYARRDKLLACIKDWQSHARLNFRDDDMADENGDDPFWGSRVFRERDKIFSAMDRMDCNAMAAEDFGVVWSSTRNSVVAGLWTVLEIFSDKDLLGRVRHEVAKCRDSSPSGFDINKLVANPLLQSIYAEVLRLRVHMLITRVPVFDDLHVKGWVIARGELLVMSTTVAHMDRKVWNTGDNDQYPLNAFWAERFLKYEGVPGSGPKRRSNTTTEDECPVSRGDECPASRGDASYAVKDVEGAWFPYGGGPRQCPGRHFAKRDIIFTAAVMVTYFDIEPLVDIRSLGMDMRGFGLGTMAVAGAIPCRVRRRSGLG